MNNILVLNSKVLIYSTFIINRSNILIINNFEVLILLYLYKGNTSITSINNSSIKLEIIFKGEILVFLNQKLCLFQVYLLFFSEIIIFNKEDIISL